MARRLALAALLALALAGCGSGDESVSPAPPATTSASGAVELTGTSLDGETITLGDFRGRPVLVNVWSSW